MSETIKLSNGKTFNLLKDTLTAQDFKELSGEEVRKVEHLQMLAYNNKFMKEKESGLIPPLYGNL